MSSHYKHGTYNAICDVCGFKFKACDLKKRWDGFYVCSKDYETRHPMDLYRYQSKERPLPWTRPDPPVEYEVVPFAPDPLPGGES